jgi:RNA recognition motif-containing protein
MFWGLNEYIQPYFYFIRHTDEYDDKAISVGGMPYDTTEEDILSYFSECGEIGHVICMKFPDTQRFSGLAIITFKVHVSLYVHL